MYHYSSILVHFKQNATHSLYLFPHDTTPRLDDVLAQWFQLPRY